MSLHTKRCLPAPESPVGQATVEPHKEDASLHRSRTQHQHVFRNQRVCFGRGLREDAIPQGLLLVRAGRRRWAKCEGEKNATRRSHQPICVATPRVAASALACASQALRGPEGRDAALNAMICGRFLKAKTLATFNVRVFLNNVDYCPQKLCVGQGLISTNPSRARRPRRTQTTRRMVKSTTSRRRRSSSAQQLMRTAKHSTTQHCLPRQQSQRVL
jgi:hypothetical protein